jgi:hypothetical protein
LPQMRHTDHNGHPAAPYEGYPSAESWGTKGWTFTSLAKALAKAQQLAQKASCAGTVSRRNRFDGRKGLRGRLMGHRPRTVPLTNRFPLPAGRSRQTPTQRQVNPSVARHCISNNNPTSN